MLEVLENKIIVFWFENFASNVIAVELSDEVILIDSKKPVLNSLIYKKNYQNATSMYSETII
ncbi:MAG: hypothetical protein B6I29_04585 [Marinitoga sp. 4572_148]|nr:MAG: hypothetical protein B6I29_04585 [Marinitoga sp. 4572_148]